MATTDCEMELASIHDNTNIKEYLTDLFQSNEDISTMEKKLCLELYNQNKQLCCGGRESSEGLRKAFYNKGLGISKNNTKCTNHGPCNDCVALTVTVEAAYVYEGGGNSPSIYDNNRNCIGVLKKASGYDWVMSKTGFYNQWDQNNIYFDFLEGVSSASVSTVGPYVVYGQLYFDEGTWKVEKTPLCDICDSQCNSSLLSKTKDIDQQSVLDVSNVPQSWKAFKSKQEITLKVVDPTAARSQGVKLCVDNTQVVVELRNGNNTPELVADQLYDAILEQTSFEEEDNDYLISIDGDMLTLTSTAPDKLQVQSCSSCIHATIKKPKQIHTCYCGFCLQHWMDVLKDDKDWVEKFCTTYHYAIWPNEVENAEGTKEEIKKIVVKWVKKESEKWSQWATEMQFKLSDNTTSRQWVQVVCDNPVFRKTVQGLLDACQATIHVNRDTKRNSVVKNLKHQLKGRYEESHDVAPGSAPSIVFWLAFQALNQLQIADNTSLETMTTLVGPHITNNSTPFNNPPAFRNAQIEALENEVSELKETLKELRPTKRLKHKATKSKKRSRHERHFETDSDEESSSLSEDSSEDSSEEESSLSNEKNDDSSDDSEEDNLGLTSYNSRKKQVGV